MLAEREDEVLRGDAAGLRACEEEGQDFVDDADLAIFEMILHKEHRQEVACVG